MKRKVILQGVELEDYLDGERVAAELEAKREALLERSRRMMQEDAESDSDSDADGSDTEVAAPTEDSKMDGTGTRRRFGGFAGGAGAWDEFLDPLSLQGAGGQSFDVYVKGAYSKRVGGEGKEALGRFRMFPVVERKRRVDVYGEAIDVEGWLRRGVEDQSFKPVTTPVAVVKRSREEDEEVEVSTVPADEREDTDGERQDKPELPHKYVVDQVVVNLMCTLFVVDMEGQADGRALKTILPQINPRKLVRLPLDGSLLVLSVILQVIVNGNEEAVADLAAACRSVASMTEEIYTPAVGECITVGEETKNFSVRLGDTVMATLKMSRVSSLPLLAVGMFLTTLSLRSRITTSPTSLVSFTWTPNRTSQSSRRRARHERSFLPFLLRRISRRWTRIPTRSRTSSLLSQPLSSSVIFVSLSSKNVSTPLVSLPNSSDRESSSVDLPHPSHSDSSVPRTSIRGWGRRRWRRRRRWRLRMRQEARLRSRRVGEAS